MTTVTTEAHQMKTALEAIADMQVTEGTDTAEVLALCIAIAQIELANHEGAYRTARFKERMTVFNARIKELILQGLPSEKAAKQATDEAEAEAINSKLQEGDITTKEFDKYLGRLLESMEASDLLEIPGVYELVAEDLNNAVIEQWEQHSGTA